MQAAAVAKSSYQCPCDNFFPSFFVQYEQRTAIDSIVGNFSNLECFKQNNKRDLNFEMDLFEGDMF